MITTIIILAVLLIVGIYIIWNLMRKVERLEDVANNYGGYLNEVTDVIGKMNERIIEIDSNGTFASDDEVGFFFTELKDMQNILNSININESTTQEERS